MADTWVGNAYNQCVSFKAFLNGVSTGGFAGGCSNATPDTRELITVANTNTYNIGIYGYDGSDLKMRIGGVTKTFTLI